MNLKLAFIIFCFASIGINSQEPALKLSSEEIILKPFTVDATYAALMNLQQPKFRYQQYQFTKAAKESIQDTIIKIYSGKKIELFINKRHGKEWLFTGKILSDKMELNGGIRVGQHKNDVVKIIADIENIPGDTLRLRSSKYGRNLSFIFEKDILREVRIDNLSDR